MILDIYVIYNIYINYDIIYIMILVILTLERPFSFKLYLNNKETFLRIPPLPSVQLVYMKLTFQCTREISELNDFFMYEFGNFFLSTKSHQVIYE